MSSRETQPTFVRRAGWGASLLGALSLFGADASAQSQPPVRRESASYSSSPAEQYCRNLVAKAFAWVKSGRRFDDSGLNFEEVLDCIPSSNQRNQFMDAVDANDARTPARPFIAADRKN